MTDHQLFAFVILPIIIGILGIAVAVVFSFLNK